MYRRLLNNPNFIFLWIGQAVSATGDYFTLLVIPIFINRLTGSVMLVGLSFIFTALPALVLGPVAGVFVDRLDRRKVMIASDVLRGVLMLSLLTIRDASQVWVVYLVGFLVSCTAQFFFPARAAVMPLIVTNPQDWLAANGILRVIQTMGMLAGPALAGITIGHWGEPVAFIADGTSFLISALAIFFMKVPRTTPGNIPGSGTLSGVWNDLRDGLAFLFVNRTALGVLICMTMASLGFSTVNMIWIPYLQQRYGVGASGLGIADAALGVGMLVSGLLVGQLARRMSKTVISAGGLVLIGLIYITIILLPAFGWIIAWQFLGGLALTPMQSALDTITQLVVPDLKRGRVTSAMNAAYSTAGLVSMALASLFGDAVGLGAVFLIVGLFVVGSG
ncbi:MAG: MFS transporter, partial [Chloroflexi bacterium]|nr:MFS transporter [Chloroflexota bacterium]